MANSNNALALIIAVAVLVIVAEATPIVYIKGVKVKGAVIDSAESFFGVPYAQSPVGELRLEKPRPFDYEARHVIQKEDEFINCTTWTNHPPCYSQSTMEGITYSENCLRSTIHRPVGTLSCDRLPVVVFIHGGGFYTGATYVDAPPSSSGFLDLYISQGLEGNLGFFDQQLALKWVNENIVAFGGDNSRVTLWGQSAGAASVSVHSVNPTSSPLFQRAIQASGSMNAPWAAPSCRAAQSTRNIAMQLGCTSYSNGDDLAASLLPAGAPCAMKRSAPGLKACLRDAPISSIIAATNASSSLPEDFNVLNWGPTPGGDFFNETPAPSSPLPRKATLYTFNTDESIILTYLLNAIRGNWAMPNSANFSQYSAEDLTTFIRLAIQPLDLHNSAAVQDAEGIRQALVDFYTAPQPSLQLLSRPNGASPYFIQRTRLESDIEFIVPLYWEARAKAQLLGWPVYMLHFAYVSDQLASQLPYAAALHGNEYLYTLGHVATRPNYSLKGGEDFAVAKRMHHIFVSFIKHGQPRDGELMLFNGSEASILTVAKTEVQQEQQEAMEQRLALWDRLASAYGLAKIRGLPSSEVQPSLMAAAATTTTNAPTKTAHPHFPFVHHEPTSPFFSGFINSFYINLIIVIATLLSLLLFFIFF